MFSYQPKYGGQHISICTQPDKGRNSADVEDVMLDGKVERKKKKKGGVAYIYELAAICCEHD